MRSLATFIMAGRLRAMLVASAATLLSFLLPPVTAPLGYLGSAAVMLVTLRQGPLEGLVVLAGAAVATAASIAFPPRLRISKPACAANPSLVATTPCFARTLLRLLE